MKVLDTPLRPLAGRTLREAIIVGGGLGACAYELRSGSPNPWHLGVFAVGTAMFALRFFAARVVAIGVLLSAIAAHLANLRHTLGWYEPELFWGVYPMAAGVLLLLSRDLANRFDFAESGPGWRLNRWRALPRSHWRASVLLGWLLGILGHFLLRAWQPAGEAAPVWALIAILVCIGGIFLLFTGRSIVFVITAALGVAVAALVIPQVGAAEALLVGDWTAARPTSILWNASPSSALPAALAATGIALVSLPYAALHLWHGLRGRG
jgi:hypothetical protein